MAAPVFHPSTDFIADLDALLYEVCEELQLTPGRHIQAEQRYHAVAGILEGAGSPFADFGPKIYPQGSMRLGTTVRPIQGPHDLDFVFELSAPYERIDPMKLIQTLFEVLKSNGVYRDMVELKNRCVRIIYANEFYMDILPACVDSRSGANCIQIPDRQVKSWKPSNPIGYADWFKRQVVLSPRVLLEKAVPLPAQQRTEDKRPLQLIVQLIKRWRDLYFEGTAGAPISIVLTTLAADHYQGEQSIGEGLLIVLDRIVSAIATAERQGSRLAVHNPSNHAEDLSERWDEDPSAYRRFTCGIREFAADWREVLSRGRNLNSELNRLFGEAVVEQGRVKKAQHLQEARKAGLLGVTSAGRIVSVSAGTTPLRANTFHGV